MTALIGLGLGIDLPAGFHVLSEIQPRAYDRHAAIGEGMRGS